MTAIDRLLGRVPLHALTWIALAAVALVALVESLVGALSVGPLTLLAHLSLLLATSHLVNQLVARAVRVHPHTPSTTITALLLFFLLPPSLAPSDLVAAVIAALLAIASKYLLVVRGRHVLNPAALGVLLVGLLGLSFGSWWVATPPLLPAVAVAGLVVLVRVRKLLVGVVYVVVGAAVTVGRLVATGTGAGDALSLALGSFPLVFAAAFMLSEPLTLPPRRWQQLVVAALAALVASVPFSTGSLPLGAVDLGALHYDLRLGPLASTPELGLLVGNVVAFLLGQRGGVRLELVSRRELSATSAELAFRPTRPVRFRAGQFVELALPHAPVDRRGSRRVLSIASAPEDGTIHVGVRLAEPLSSFKRALLALEPGDRVAATSVGGDFLLPADPAAPLLLVAGGIGVTPFVSQLRGLAARCEQRDLVVLYATGASGDQGYLPDLLDAADRIAGARVVVASRERPADARAEWIGPERADAAALAAAIPDLARRRVAVSGSPAFVGGIRRSLRAAGARRIRSDVFLGY